MFTIQNAVTAITAGLFTCIMVILTLQLHPASTARSSMVFLLLPAADKPN